MKILHIASNHVGLLQRRKGRCVPTCDEELMGLADHAFGEDTIPYSNVPIRRKEPESKGATGMLRTEMLLTMVKSHLYLQRYIIHRPELERI